MGIGERSPGKLLVRERGHKWITVVSDLGLGWETWEWNCGVVAVCVV